MAINQECKLSELFASDSDQEEEEVNRAALAFSSSSRNNTVLPGTRYKASKITITCAYLLYI